VEGRKGTLGEERASGFKKFTSVEVLWGGPRPVGGVTCRHEKKGLPQSGKGKSDPDGYPGKESLHEGRGMRQGGGGVRCPNGVIGAESPKREGRPGLLFREKEDSLSQGGYVSGRQYLSQLRKVPFQGVKGGEGVPEHLQLGRQVIQEND